MARNCCNINPPKEGVRGFTFFIGTVQYKHEIEEKTINQCPVGFISELSWLLWSKYQDCKALSELGITGSKEDLRRLHFEAYKIFMQAEGEHFEQDMDKKKSKKGKK